MTGASPVCPQRPERRPLCWLLGAGRNGVCLDLVTLQWRPGHCPRPFSTGVTVYFRSEPCRGGLHVSADIPVLASVGGFCGCCPPFPPTPAHLLLLLSSPDPPFYADEAGRGALCERQLRLQLCLGLVLCRTVLCTGLRLDPVGEGFGCVVGCALEPAQAAVCSRVLEPECSHAEVWGSNSHCPLSYWDFSLRPRSGKGGRRLRCLRHVTWQLSACWFLVT